MTLTDEQKQKVRDWAAAGASLNDIQTRLRDQFEISMTYMQARLLLIDLDVKLQEDQADDEPPEKRPATADPAEYGDDDAFLEDEDEADVAPGPAGAGKVQITVDELALPGAIASGRAVFSDGKRVSWVLDQLGRLSLQGAEPGYQPPAQDIPVFQRELQMALRRRGY